MTLAASCAIALLLAEIVLTRTLVEQYFVWPANLDVTLAPNPERLPGILGTSRFITNALGIRGDPPPADARLRILAVGGSTTECLYLDQQETWPHLLQERLSDVSGGPVWVGNVGKAGHSTRHHRLVFEKLLNQLPDLDVILMLVGANDFHMRIIRDDRYRVLAREDAGYPERLLTQTFADMPVLDERFPMYKRTAVWRALRQARNRLAPTPIDSPVQDVTGEYLQTRRLRRQRASLRSALPDLRAALGEYRAHLNELIDDAKRRGIELVLMTQPTMWRDDLPSELERLLWAGWVGDYSPDDPGEYYSAAALDRGMKQFDAVLLDVCSERDVPCIDLAAALPKDTRSFYDDMHYNEEGARRVANIVAQRLIALDRLPLK